MSKSRLFSLREAGGTLELEKRCWVPISKKKTIVKAYSPASGVFILGFSRVQSDWRQFPILDSLGSEKYPAGRGVNAPVGPCWTIAQHARALGSNSLSYKEPASAPPPGLRVSTLSSGNAVEFRCLFVQLALFD